MSAPAGPARKGPAAPPTPAAPEAPATPPVPTPAPPPAAPDLPTSPPPQVPVPRMSVHVYSKDPARRFIILDSLRLREGEGTPDGLLVREIRPDGAVLEYQGARFFLHR
jgi:general secretion pathway protein B